MKIINAKHWRENGDRFLVEFILFGKKWKLQEWHKNVREPSVMLSEMKKPKNIIMKLLNHYYN